MGTTTAKLQKILDTKEAIRTAIISKGVPVLETDTFASYPSKIVDISGGGSWVKPAEWPDISNVANNEIKLLVSNKSNYYSFRVVVSSGTFSVDWGDGTVENGLASDTKCLHQYVPGTGTPLSCGEEVYTIRIYTSGGTITRFYVVESGTQARMENQAYLWAEFGTIGLTRCDNMFYIVNKVACQNLQRVTIPSFVNLVSQGLTDAFNFCYGLTSVNLPSTWTTAVNLTRAFRECHSISKLELPVGWNSSNLFSAFYNSSIAEINLPETWSTTLTDVNSAFYGTNLQCVRLPSSWGNITDAGSMFRNVYTLRVLELPSTWGNITRTADMLRDCRSLTRIVLPATRSNTLTNYSGMFFGCSSLKEIVNIESMGSTSVACDFFETFRDCELLTGTLTFDAMFTRFYINGSTTAKNKITGLRLTNPNSPFSGTSPQIDVSYTDLSATALNTLFGDLPTLSGKTIRITGATGAATCTPSIATNKGWTVTN